MPRLNSTFFQNAFRYFALLGISVVMLSGCIPLEEDTPTAQPTSSSAETGRVVDIIDGDTIDVRIDGEVFRVRYIGVNTPERDEPCYEDATAANAALVEGRTVTLERDVSETDKYGRLLRYVYAGEIFVNAELVAEGYAEARAYPPDTAYQDYFDGLENTAIQARLGCHPTGVFQ